VFAPDVEVLGREVGYAAGEEVHGALGEERGCEGWVFGVSGEGLDEG